MMPTARQPAWLDTAVLVMTLGYPFALHVAVLSNSPRAALALLATVASSHALSRRAATRRVTRLIAAGVALFAMVGLGIEDISALYLPPMLVSAGLLYVFAHSLLPGETPLVTQVARYIDGELDVRTARYTRGLTWVWTFFFAGMLVECVLLPWVAPLEVWSLFTNVLNYVLIAGLFLLEYVYRLLHFRRWPTVQSLREALQRRRLPGWSTRG